MFKRFVLFMASTVMCGSVLSADQASAPDLAPFRTPYKYGKIVLGRSSAECAFDSKGVDGAFVGSIDGKFYMTYIGFDGAGYQTGLATPDDAKLHRLFSSEDVQGNLLAANSQRGP